MQKYGLSLNPKKYHFAMQEGKLLGILYQKMELELIHKWFKPFIRLIYQETKKKFNHS